MISKNQIIRYIEPLVHHYLVRYQHYNIVTDQEKLSQNKQCNFSYLSCWNPTNHALQELREKIISLSAICNQVCVNLGEPGFMWNHPWQDLKKTDMVIYSTIDYINSFNEKNINFFLNLVPLKAVTKPTYYVNDMFFYGNELYLMNEKCNALLNSVDKHVYDKKYFWEAMCSYHERQYRMIKDHAISEKTLSTCRSLGVTYYSSKTIKPLGKGAETFSNDYEDRNIRTSDLLDPEIYNQSHYSLVFETVRHKDFAMFSEKEAKPIMAKRLFVVFGSPGHIKAFKKLGFRSFDKVMDESFDNIENDDQRLHKILDSMMELSRENPNIIYNEISEILDHNYNHFISRHWNQEFISSWENPLDFFDQSGEL